MKVVVAGGTGFVGNALVRRLLDEKHHVIVLSRNAGTSMGFPGGDLRIEPWDGRSTGGWTGQLEGADAVVNLSGEGIADKRWSAERKKRLISSRLDSTKALVDAIEKCSKRPKVLVNASAVGYYGVAEDSEVDEASPKGTGFLADLCAEWERQARKAEALGVRVVMLRLGVVIGKGGGALQKFILPFNLFIGGPLGSGRQYFPWVHRDDVVGAILYVLQDDRLAGPVNVSAPDSLTMSQFCRVLGKAMDRPSWAPVPSFMLKMLLGEMSSMVLTGQRAVPRKLREAGYRFCYPDAESALKSLFKTLFRSGPDVDGPHRGIDAGIKKELFDRHRHA